MVLRNAVAFAILGCFSLAPCQTSSSAYESFFRQVLQLSALEKGRPVLLNGEPAEARHISLRGALGLTSEEFAILTGVASDCETKLRAFLKDKPDLVFSARLKLVESPDDPEAARQLRELDREHREIVLSHVQRLRQSLGETRFAPVDAFVRSGKPLVSLLPLPKSAPAARK